MKLKKLDKRMSGYGDFARCIDFKSADLEKFIEIRNWCWETWGPSCELDKWYKVKNPSKHWAWLMDEWRIRLYFSSDKEAQWFHLKWG